MNGLSLAIADDSQFGCGPASMLSFQCYQSGCGPFCRISLVTAPNIVRLYTEYKRNVKKTCTNVTGFFLHFLKERLKNLKIT